MANKYCNLDGTKKISKEFGKITEGFRKVEDDVENIIVTPAEGISEQEIIQARRGRPTLGRKMEDLEHGIAGIDKRVNDRLDTIIATPTTISEEEIIDARQGDLSLGSNIRHIKKESSVIYGHEDSIIRKGKNLWDGQYVTDIRLVGSTDSGYIVKAYTNISIVFKGVRGRTYTISKPNDTNAGGIGTFAKRPKVGDSAIRVINDNSSYYATKTVTLTGDEEYLMFYLSSTEQMKKPAWFQIEEGVLPTRYTSPRNIVAEFEDGSIPQSSLGDLSIRPEDTTFAKRGRNLWDGTYVRDYRMGGVEPGRVTHTPGAISVVFKGTPKKTYTISRSDDTDWGGIFILDTYPNIGQVGTRMLRGNMENWDATTITLQGEETYIWLSLSSPDQSTEPNWLQIEEGSEVTDFIQPNSVAMNIESITIDVPKQMHIIKTDASITIYIPSKTNSNIYLGHVYRHHQNAVTNTWLYDSAGLYKRSRLGFSLTSAFSPGNSDNEGVLRIQGEGDFVGGKHGYDYMEDISLIIDGRDTPLSKIIDRPCSFVKIVNKSRVNHDLSEDTPENKVFTRYKAHVWNEHSMTMHGKWIAEKALSLTSVKLCDFSINQVVGDHVFSKWGRNDVDFIKHDVSSEFPTTPSVKNVRTQEIWSEDVPFYIALSCDFDREKYPNHITNIEHLGGTRAKIYFDFGACSLEKGDIIEYRNDYAFEF